MSLEYTSKSKAREIIQSNENVIMLNSFPGCTQCDKAERALMSVKDQLPGVMLLKINTTDSAELLGEFGVRANGSLVFINDGVKVSSLLTSDNNDILRTYRTSFSI